MVCVCGYVCRMVSIDTWIVGDVGWYVVEEKALKVLVRIVG